MPNITITLPDGSKKQIKKGTTGNEIAESIGPRLAKAAIAITVNNELYDLFRPIQTNADIAILTFDQPDGKKAFWHSTAHILAQAVTELWPETKPTIGPAIEEGFYYDFDKKEPFTPEDLNQIESKMKEIVKKDLNVKRKEVTATEAKTQFKNNKYKKELIDEFKEGLTIYSQGDYHELCRGGHVPSTGLIKAFKLTKISSAYWRGDAKNASLQRIYGISFPKQKDLDEYLHLLEEAEKRDHRKLGPQLDLFSFHDVSPGSPFFHPKGVIILNTLLNFMRKEYDKRGYQEVSTPQLFHKELWETSGHWQHFKENMFLTQMDEQDASLKPMNCPAHILIYKTAVRSYRELPLRLADFGPLHRNELRGTLGGLFRVRKLQQDDAHIFCPEDKIGEEVHEVIDFVKHVYQTFGFDFHVELSTKPEKAMGADKLWEEAETSLQQALKKAKLDFKLNPGDGAFYGPKIDFHIKDTLGRSWQCATVQLDFNQPERFNVRYDGADGKKHKVIIIHRAIFGSLERFMGILIEHYAAKFPLWLNPNQVILIPIADRHIDYCEKTAKTLKEAGLRVSISEHADTTNKKIREAQLQKYNYILVVGDKEVKNSTVNVRTRNEEVHGEKKINALVKDLVEEIEKKR
jgi:threonyl-tRNA synthetase